jgi:hypothetical protein
MRTYRRPSAHASDLVQPGRATSLDLGFSTLLAKASLLSSTLSGRIARRRDTLSHDGLSSAGNVGCVGSALVEYDRGIWS